MQLAVATEGTSSSPAEVREWVAEVREGLLAGRLAPYLGPGLYPADGPVPSTYRALADFLGSRVALPRRARGNLWAAAQYIETKRHRQTAEALMAEAFAAAGDPLPIHRFLASLPLPLVVDGWYDAGMQRALAARTDWVEVQGGSRVAVGEDRWFRTYAPDGRELAHEAARGATTVLYKPHGAIEPARSFLVSDADYVEVLTEIDIQTPIPEVVTTRRTSLGFVYLGCRFHDQTLRIFARQIGKRSEGPRYAVVDPDVGASKNELRFFEETGTRVVRASPRELCAALAAG